MPTHVRTIRTIYADGGTLSENILFNDVKDAGFLFS